MTVEEAKEAASRRLNERYRADPECRMVDRDTSDFQCTLVNDFEMMRTNPVRLSAQLASMLQYNS